MPSITRSDMDAARRAATAMNNLASGWGAASDAKDIASFLESAATNAPLFRAFADELDDKKIWHPAHIKEFVETRLAKDPGTKDWVGAGSPLGVRLQSLTAKPEKDLDPAKVGRELQNLATGWFNNEVLVLLLQQLPSILKDEFAFAAMAKHADGMLKTDVGAEATKEAVQKTLVGLLKDGPDAATSKLLTKLQAALA